jgi:hypothetical protein
MKKGTLRDWLESVRMNIGVASEVIDAITQEALFRAVDSTRSIQDEELYASLAKAMKSLYMATEDLEIAIGALTPRKSIKT